MTTQKHIARVHQELKEVGVTPYGFMKLSTRYVPNVIGLDERIGGAVYGWAPTGSSILIATDRRIIFIDRKPFFTSSDELTYDVVSGVKIHTAGPFCTVVLHTRLRDFRLKYVNENCAAIFVKFIEQRRINPGVYDQSAGKFKHKDEAQSDATPVKSEGADTFIKSHKTGVLSTVNNDKAHSSVVHYISDEHENVYLVTTPDSRKVQYIAKNPKVSLTIFELDTEITVRIEGFATIEQDDIKKRDVILELSKLKTAQYEQFTQHVSTEKKELIVLRIEPIRTELTNYRKKHN